MEIAHYSYGVAAVLHTALLIALLRADRSSVLAQKRTFVAAVGCTAVWAACAFWAIESQSRIAGLAATLFDLARYGCWFWCLLDLATSAHTQRSSRLRAVLATSGALLVVGALVVPSLLAATSLHNSEIARAARMLTLAMPVFGLVLIEQLYRNAEIDEKWSLKPLCLGVGLLFVFDTYLFSQAALFSRVDTDALDIRPAVHALTVPFLLVAQSRRARPAGQFRVSRSAAFHTAALMLVGSYLLFVSAVGYYVRAFGGTWGGALQIGLLFGGTALLAALILSESMRAKLRVFIGKHFFSYRYDYRAEWLRFTGMLSASSAPEQVGELVVRGLAGLVESPAGMVWSRELSGDGFVQTARWNMPRSTVRESLDTPLVRFLQDRDWIVDLAEQRLHPHRYDDIAMPPWLREVPEAWLVIPLHVGESLTGFVVLAQPRTPLQVDWEVRDLLKTASRQAAGFLAQMHATEALLEARKFEAFNRMSAFVVHDLKNIVTQLSLMMKNARRLGHDPEFQQDMLETVDHAVDKMRQLMVQLREGEKPADGISGVPLAPLLQRLATSAAQRGRSVELELADEPSTRGSVDRLERVLGHLVQNALDATTPEQRVWVQLARASGQARLVIGDSGRGMTPEFVQTRLFKPFSSTKGTGMGIGAYESFQTLRELGGSIEVDSEVGRGTVITVLLPLFETRRTSDLDTADAR